MSLDIAPVNSVRNVDSRTVNIVFEGDSFMNPTNGFIDVLKAAIVTSGIRTSMNSNAANGGTISAIPAGGDNNYMLYSGRIASANALYYSGFLKNILCCFEGINEVAGFLLQTGNSNATIMADTYAAYEAYYSTARTSNAGFKMILNTLTPRTDQSAGVNANYEIIRQNASDKLDVTTINGKLRSEFTTATGITRVWKSALAKWAGCLLVDPGDDPDIGQAGQSADTTYYKDLVHLTPTTGCSLMTNRYYLPAVLYIHDGLL